MSASDKSINNIECNKTSQKHWMEPHKREFNFTLIQFIYICHIMKPYCSGTQVWKLFNPTSRKYTNYAEVVLCEIKFHEGRKGLLTHNDRSKRKTGMEAPLPTLFSSMQRMCKPVPVLTHIISKGHIFPKYHTVIPFYNHATFRRVVYFPFVKILPMEQY